MSTLKTKKNLGYSATLEGKLNILRHSLMIGLGIVQTLNLVILHERLEVNILTYVSLFLILLGAYISIPINMKRMGAIVEANFVHESGPFKYCRNPFYLGQTLFAIGITFVLYPLVVTTDLILLALYIIVNHATIVSEEKRLIAKFEKKYEIYQTRVSRYFPSFRNWIKFLKSVNK